MAYNTYPAVDDAYNFPSQVRDALAKSTEFAHLKWGKPLPSGFNDLNNLVADGLYSVTLAGVLNRPEALKGNVSVYTIDGDVIQDWVTLSSPLRKYSRSRIGNLWTPWVSQSWSRAADPTVKDLNLFTTDGFYAVTAAGVANRPVATFGGLTVTVVSGVVNQVWDTFEARPRKFTRSRDASNVWSSWVAIGWDVPEAIGSTGDLDTYQNPGSYIVTSGSVKNKPTSGLGFLEVIKIASTAFIQRWTAYDSESNPMVRHFKSGTGWGVWTSSTWWKSHLVRYVDLNTLLVPSAHSLTWIDHPNQPSARVGTLTVTVGGAITVQTFEPSTGAPTKFRRTYSDSVWGSWEEFPESGAGNTSSVSSLSLWNATPTSKAIGTTVSAYTTNKVVGFNSNVTNGEARFTKNDGTTWSVLTVFPDSLSSIQQLPNGELLAVVGSDPNPRALWLSSGYTDANPAGATWTKVLTASGPYIYYPTAWAFSIHENIIVVAEYGPKTPTWNGYTITDPARYVSISKDYGKTWRRIFDLTAYLKEDRKLTNIPEQHMHGVLWDPYWNRVWITFGDNTNGLLYSDDEGVNWKTAFWGPVPSSPWQGVGMAALPGCILIGSDGPPNGVWRVSRAGGKASTDLKIEPAYVVPNDVGLLSHLCQAIHKIPSTNGNIFLFGFGTETRAGKTFIVGTRDGYSFTRIWEDTAELMAGRGVRTIAGPSLNGDLIVGSNDEKVASKWTEWRGKYTGDPIHNHDDRYYTEAEVESKLDVLVSRIKVLEYDTNWVPIPLSSSLATSGALLVRRQADTVWMDFDEIKFVDNPSGSFVQMPNILPSGFRPDQSYVYLPLAKRSSSYSEGPIRVDRYGTITCYNNDGALVVAHVSFNTKTPRLASLQA